VRERESERERDLTGGDGDIDSSEGFLKRLPVSKETYYSVKRDLLQCQKRPTTVSKETYYSSEGFLKSAIACTRS
jgi:hypothetical protein